MRGELRRIQNRYEVMCHEVAVVACSTSKAAQIIFQIRKRADDVPEFAERAPDDGRQMQPGKPRPAQDRQAARDHEQHEAQMNDDDAVGQQ